MDIKELYVGFNPVGNNLLVISNRGWKACLMLNIFFTNKKSTSNHIKVVLKALIYIFTEAKKCYRVEEQLQGTFQADMGSNRIQNFKGYRISCIFGAPWTLNYV